MPHVETTVGQLVAADMLPAVWFIFSRKGCDQAARYLAERGASLVTPRERREIESALAAFEARTDRLDHPEIASEDLRIAVRSLARITGRVDVEDLLDVIFRDFCIGK